MLRHAAIGAAAFVLSSCADHPPTLTTNPIGVSPDRSDIVSICYDAKDHGRSDIEAIAMENCPKGTVSLTPWKTDRVLNDCPMLKKSRISFVCVPAGGTW